MVGVVIVIVLVVVDSGVLDGVAAGVDVVRSVDDGVIVGVSVVRFE